MLASWRLTLAVCTLIQGAYAIAPVTGLASASAIKLAAGSSYFVMAAGMLIAGKSLVVARVLVVLGASLLLCFSFASSPLAIESAAVNLIVCASCAIVIFRA